MLTLLAQGADYWSGRASNCTGDSCPVNVVELNKSIWGSSNGGSTILLGQSCSDLTSPGGVITCAFPYMFAAAGLILFVMLLWGGYEVMFAAATPKSAESGKQRITAAVVGFLILFVAYWIGQIVQTMFGIEIGIA